MDTLLWKSCILVLLPMIPAIVIFAFFPSAKGEGEGTLYGMRWKFGGAFAGYLIVALLLWTATKSYFEMRDAEVWTVRGSVVAKGIPNIPNILSVRSMPQTFAVDTDGSYEFRVIVNRGAGDKLIFPKLVFDFSRACLGMRGVPLDDMSSTFSALDTPASVKVKRRDADRSIDVAPLVLESMATVDAHCPG